MSRNLPKVWRHFFRTQLENTTEGITEKINNVQDTIKDVHQYINDKLSNLSKDPSNIFIHVGSNDLQNGTSPENLLTL